MDKNASHGLTTIICRIDALIFKKEGNATIIFSGTRDNGKSCRVICEMDNPVIGSVVSAEGCWRKHDKYGWQFKASTTRTVVENPLGDVRCGLRCTITDVKTLKVDTGFCVAHGADENGEPVRLSGRLEKMKPEVPVFAYGKWSESERFGKEFKVSKWEFTREGRTGMLQRAADFVERIWTEAMAKENAIEVSWADVQFRDRSLLIPGRGGRLEYVYFSDARESYEMLKPMLVDRIEKLKLIYDSDGYPRVLNLSVLRDAISVMNVRHTLDYFMPEETFVASVYDMVKDMDPEATKAFVPRDMTPYMEFLQKSQEPMYGVVPIVEFNGWAKEDAFLFTISIDGKPCIVWENVNDARATFVFECTEDNYYDRLQLIVDFIGGNSSKKRQYLHSENCAELFGEKPRCVVHNNVESWGERLMVIE